MSEMAIFEGVGMQVIDHHEDRWITLRDLGKALGYENPADVRFVVDRNPEEFKGKQGVCKMHTPSGNQEVRILNYRGVIRVAMKSDAPKAVKFRDWADELSAEGFLELTKLRVQCWRDLAGKPRNRCLWNALYATYGGPKAYKRNLGNAGLRTPESSEDWEEFERQQAVEDDAFADFRAAEYGDPENERPAANGPLTNNRKDN
jgi:hypothetical protein